MNTRDVIINKLAKLLRLKEGAETIKSNNEAERVEEKIKRLREKYNVTDDELNRARNADTVGNFFTEKIRTHEEHLTWQQLLARGVASEHHCQLIFTKDMKSIRFVGSQRDIAVCSTQFKVLNLAAIEEFSVAKAEIEEFAPKHLKRDFFHGFVATILLMFKERRKNNSEALVRIGKELVKYLDENFEKAEPGNGLSIEITNYLALMAGSSAARKQSLDINQLKEGEINE